MKVNTALLMDEDTLPNPVKEQKQEEVQMAEDKGKSDTHDTGDKIAGRDTGQEDANDAGEQADKPNRHPKAKTFMLIAAMVSGFVLCVWSMTGIVNNMRIDSQGYVMNVISETVGVEDFMESDGNEDISSTIPKKTVTMESEVSDDATRNGLNDSGSMTIESSDVAALRKEVEDARNEAALVRQELKNAEDMLDSSLAREAELQNKLDALTKNN